MALSLLTVWEIRPTGNDANGGGFVAGSGGTDYSQQDAPQVVVNNTTITATTAAAGSNVITFTGYAPTANDINNLFQATGGTNITAGLYQIIAQTATTWTVVGAANLTNGTGAGSAITGNMGGAFVTPKKAGDNYQVGNRFWVKSGTYQALTTPVMTLALNGIAVSSTQPPTWLSGYYQTRGDIGYGPKGANAAHRPVFQLGATASANLQVANFSAGTATAVVENIVFDGNNIAGSIGLNIGAGALVRGCSAINCPNACFNFTNTGIIEYCDAYGGAGIGIYSATAGLTIDGCSIHDLNLGINASGPMTIDDCIIANINGQGVYLNTGAGPIRISRNTIVGCHEGIWNQNANFGLSIKNNVIADNSNVGIRAASYVTFDDPQYDGNTLYGNVNGNFANVASGGLTSLPYAHNYDIIAAADPVISHVSGTANFPTDNFGLVVGSGARSATWLSKLPGNTATTAYGDMGAVQSQAAAAAGGIFGNSLNGGLV